MFKIKTTGINGYLGTLIKSELERQGHTVSGISRKLLYGDIAALQNEIRNTDILINLAGVNILRRWTPKNKSLIYDSRVVTTTNLVHAIQELPQNEQPKKVISASAIGIYKAGDTHSESSTRYDNGFIGKVVKEWEAPLKDLPNTIQLVLFRIAPVLGRESKTIKNLLLPFKLGLGGKIGSGKQAFPFVHEKDVVNAFLWSVNSINNKGIFNLCAPENISNAEFTKALAKRVKRPAILPVPTFALRMLYGQAAEILTDSPQALPEELLSNGFEFSYPTIDDTLNEIIK